MQVAVDEELAQVATVKVAGCAGRHGENLDDELRWKEEALQNARHRVHRAEMSSIGFEAPHCHVGAFNEKIDAGWFEDGQV